MVYEKETVLYKRTDYLGQKKTIHLNYDVNMLISATAVHPDGSEEELISFELNEILNITKKDMFEKETTTRPKISLAFELSRSHLLQLLSAKINVEETVLEEIIPEIKEEKKSDDKSEKTADETDDSQAEATEEEKTEESTDEAAEESTEEATEEVAEVEKEYKEVVVPHTFSVNSIEKPFNTRLLNDE